MSLSQCGSCLHAPLGCHNAGYPTLMLRHLTLRETVFRTLLPWEHAAPRKSPAKKKKRS